MSISNENFKNGFVWLDYSGQTKYLQPPQRRNHHRSRSSHCIKLRPCKRDERSRVLTSRPEPGFVPQFPLGAYTPNSRCRHRGTLTETASCCCMICHASGRHEHYLLPKYIAQVPNANINNDSGSREAYASQSISRETRKQRRHRLFSQTMVNQLGTWS